jgi:hypothetical protein
MALNKYGDGLKYREDIGTLSIYEQFLNHRPVFEVVVDNEDDMLAIYVGKPGSAAFVADDNTDETRGEMLIKTKGFANATLHENPDGTEDENDWFPNGITVHVNGRTVQRYVYPRVAHLLADLFVPKAEPQAEPTEADGGNDQ